MVEFHTWLLSFCPQLAPKTDSTTSNTAALTNSVYYHRSVNTQLLWWNKYCCTHVSRTSTQVREAQWWPLKRRVCADIKVIWNYSHHTLLRRFHFTFLSGGETKPFTGKTTTVWCFVMTSRQLLSLSPLQHRHRFVRYLWHSHAFFNTISCQSGWVSP